MSTYLFAVLLLSIGATIGFVLAGLLVSSRENKEIDRAFERGCEQGKAAKITEYEAIIHNQRIALSKARQEAKTREAFENECA